MFVRLYIKLISCFHLIILLSQNGIYILILNVFFLSAVYVRCTVYASRCQYDPLSILYLKVIFFIKLHTSFRIVVDASLLITKLGCHALRQVLLVGEFILQRTVGIQEVFRLWMGV